MEYTTIDTGVKHTSGSGMQRNVATGKMRYDLLIPESIPFLECMLHRWAALDTRGAQVYEERNWEKGVLKEDYDRFRASAFRHFMQWWAGDQDEDHAAAVFFNIQGAEAARYHLLRSVTNPPTGAIKDYHENIINEMNKTGETWMQVEERLARVEQAMKEQKDIPF